MAFRQNITFPTEISYRSEAIPRHQTEVITSDSGHDLRSVFWDAPRMEFDVTYAIKTLEELYSVYEIFLVVKGQKDTFRFRDFFDWHSVDQSTSLSRDLPVISPTDQVIGIGDGSTTEFQLVKRYTAGGITRLRTIKAPEVDSVRVAIDGVETDYFTVSKSTGIVTLDTAPGVGEQITAGFEFYCEVRFNTDSMTTVLERLGVGEQNDITLIEVIP